MSERTPEERQTAAEERAEQRTIGDAYTRARQQQVRAGYMRRRPARGGWQFKASYLLVIVLLLAVGLGLALAWPSSGGKRTATKKAAQPPASQPRQHTHSRPAQPPAPPATPKKDKPAKPKPAAASVPRPQIVWKPIPFSAARRAETTQYVLRHYDHRWGSGSWRLIDPRVIVEHYTASTTFSSAYNAFAADTPDPELHELPGDCAHFIVDTDGTIYQLVKTSIVCRHTVGLNWTAIGIEHVGMSDQDILNNLAQLNASLHLTLWLAQRFHIRLANIIGHNESLSSPYHHELYSAWRCQTHGDWTRADMNIYRSKLVALARHYRVSLGPPPGLRPTGC